MNLLGKLFNRKKKLVNTPELKVCIIDETSTDLWTNFGIIENRRDELIDVCKQAYKTYSNKHESYVYIVNNCKHVNEVVATTIIFERMCEGPSDHPLAELMKLLKS
jgi:hypothetical protein